MDLCRTQTIFINRKYRNTTGTTDDFDIDVQDGYLQCYDDEVVRVSLLIFSSYYSLLNIDAGYNKIYFTNTATTIATTITIDPGNYS
jgi:hypothetical protein